MRYKYIVVQKLVKKLMKNVKNRYNGEMRYKYIASKK